MPMLAACLRFDGRIKNRLE